MKTSIGNSLSVIGAALLLLIWSAIAGTGRTMPFVACRPSSSCSFHRFNMENKIKKSAEKAERSTGVRALESKMNPDPVFAQYGEPFLVSPAGKVALNERAIAVKCATDHLVKYNPTKKTYERFDAQCGFWTPMHEVGVFRLLDDLLLKLGTEHEHEKFVRTCKAPQLKSLSRMLQPYQAPVDVEERRERRIGSAVCLDRIVGVLPGDTAHEQLALRRSYLHRTNCAATAGTESASEGGNPQSETGIG